MARNRFRRRLGADIQPYELPAPAKRIVGLSTPAKLALWGLVGVGVWWFFFSSKAKATENAKFKQIPTGSETGGTSTATGVQKSFTDPGSGVVISGPATPITVTEDRTYVVKYDESWSNIAARTYGDYRWWPALWDANRQGPRYSDPSLLKAGDKIVLPMLPADPKFKDAIFARSEADRAWELKKRKVGAKKAGPRPTSTFAPTPVPSAVVQTAQTAQTAQPVQPAQTAQQQSVTAPVSPTSPAPTLSDEMNDLEQSMRDDLNSR